MSDVIITKIDESFVEVDTTEDILHEIYNRYSEMIPGAIFNPKYKCKIWDGKIHMFNIRTNMLPFGLLVDLLGYCKNKQYEFELRGMDISELKHSPNEEEYQSIISDNMKNTDKELRDYQDEAVRKALTFKKGILLSCTSSGKSLMLYNIIRYLRAKDFKRILLIVPNINLVNQMYDDFQDYGYENIDEVERLGGGHKNSDDENVLISTWESLQYKDRDYFEDFDAVFADECLDGNTMIKTKEGEKPIKDIKMGEMVLSYNEKSKKFEYKKVLETFINHVSSKSSKMLKITLENNTEIEITENHPVYTKNRGWIKAGNLTKEDDILDINNIKCLSEDKH